MDDVEEKAKKPAAKGGKNKGKKKQAPRKKNDEQTEAVPSRRDRLFSNDTMEHYHRFVEERRKG